MPVSTDDLPVEDQEEQRDDVGDLVPDPQVCREFGVTAMTLWRWDEDCTLGFPPPIRIRKRKFRLRRAIDAFKRRMLQDAIAQHRKGAA
jgi:hypothetical protein